MEWSNEEMAASAKRFLFAIAVLTACTAILGVATAEPALVGATLSWEVTDGAPGLH